MDKARLSLPAKLAPEIDHILTHEQEKLFDLVAAFGSPLNVILPDLLEQRISTFQKIYQKHHLSGEIYFTSKPNKSEAVLSKAAFLPIGVDVSSVGALKQALSAGVSAERIEATGPKNQAYLLLSLQHNIILNVDNLEELNQILLLRAKYGFSKKTRIFVRLCGFEQNRQKFTAHDTTFGVTISDRQGIFDFLRAHRDAFDFMGFAFYQSLYSDEQRQMVLETLLQVTFEAISFGLTPKGLNIGGGFHIQYAQSAEAWQKYQEDFKASLLQTQYSNSWNGNGLGHKVKEGLVTGAGNYMNHYPNHAGADDFDHMITQRLPNFANERFVDLLRDSLLELYIEPGRACFDQLGFTIGRVAFTKTSRLGEQLVSLEMNRSNIHASEHKLLMDPILLTRDRSNRSMATNGVYYFGNLCLMHDILTYHKTYPDFLPEQGDLVVFTNSAAYAMDFIESEMLHHPTAEKVALYQENGALKWCRDIHYVPFKE